jgi:hypothetical protein
MRWFFAFIVAIHGLIHLMGPAKAFGYAELPELIQPISRLMGLLWLAAAAAMLASAAALFLWPRGWWMVGAAAVVLSQVVIVTAWSDAKFGTVANVILLLGVMYGYFTVGPQSLRAEYTRDVEAGLSRPLAATAITDADLSPLPEPVQRYLRATGVVGQPRPLNYRLRFRGRIRSGPDARWMPLVVEQQSFADEPTRLFLMRATMMGVPVYGYHRLAGGHATMRIKALGAVTVAEAAGPDMDQAETVTLFNDMCLLAPGTLVDPTVSWDPIDERRARGWFTHAGHRISATLSFGDDGLITNFVSDDRLASSSDGKTFSRWRFSTPVQEYRQFGPFRLAARAEARWHPPAGEYVYGEFELLEAVFTP